MAITSLYIQSLTLLVCGVTVSLSIENVGEQTQLGTAIVETLHGNCVANLTQYDEQKWNGVESNMKELCFALVQPSDVEKYEPLQHICAILYKFTKSVCKSNSVQVQTIPLYKSFMSIINNTDICEKFRSIVEGKDFAMMLNTEESLQSGEDVNISMTQLFKSKDICNLECYGVYGEIQQQQQLTKLNNVCSMLLWNLLLALQQNSNGSQMSQQKNSDGQPLIPKVDENNPIQSTQQKNDEVEKQQQNILTTQNQATQQHNPSVPIQVSSSGNIQTENKFTTSGTISTQQHNTTVEVNNKKNPISEKEKGMQTLSTNKQKDTVEETPNQNEISEVNKQQTLTLEGREEDSPVTSPINNEHIVTGQVVEQQPSNSKTQNNEQVAHQPSSSTTKTIKVTQSSKSEIKKGEDDEKTQVDDPTEDEIEEDIDGLEESDNTAPKPKNDKSSRPLSKNNPRTDYDQQEAQDAASYNGGIKRVSIDINGSAETHFLAYFLTFTFLCIIGYLIFHNKQKIIALVIEGRKGRGGGRRGRSGSTAYHRLDNNLEEAMTSSAFKDSVTNIIY